MDDNERQFLPQELMVNFRPKQNVIYKSKFRFIVENGISCDVILKGKGSYEENHDCWVASPHLEKLKFKIQAIH